MSWRYAYGLNNQHKIVWLNNNDYLMNNTKLWKNQKLIPIRTKMNINIHTFHCNLILTTILGRLVRNSNAWNRFIWSWENRELTDIVWVSNRLMLIVHQRVIENWSVNVLSTCKIMVYFCLYVFLDLYFSVEW